MILDKSAFDAACQPGIRAALAASNLALRHAEQESFNLALDEKGDFLPGVSERRDCPLCAAPHESGAPVLRAHGMQLLRCSACRLVYSREVIRQAQDHQRYRADAPATAAFVALKENPVYRKLETTKAGYVIGQLSGFSETGKLLDIGASTGVVLEVARNMGWNAHGVEINAEAARQCQSQNLKVVCDAFPCAFPAEWNIEGKSGAEGFQAVVMLDILEHTALPRSFLSAVYRCLKPGGWLAVQVPNFRSLLLTIEGSRNNNICHGHWNYFESATLVDLLGREGFETRFLETYISELDKTLAYPRDCVAAAWEKLLGTPLDNPPPPPRKSWTRTGCTAKCWAISYLEFSGKSQSDTWRTGLERNKEGIRRCGSIPIGIWVLKCLVGQCKMVTRKGRKTRDLPLATGQASLRGCPQSSKTARITEF